MGKKFTRREFLKMLLLGGTGALIGSSGVYRYLDQKYKTLEKMKMIPCEYKELKDTYDHDLDNLFNNTRKIGELPDEYIFLGNPELFNLNGPKELLENIKGGKLKINLVHLAAGGLDGVEEKMDEIASYLRDHLHELLPWTCITVENKKIFLGKEKIKLLLEEINNNILENKIFKETSSKEAYLFLIEGNLKDRAGFAGYNFGCIELIDEWDGWWEVGFLSDEALSYCSAHEMGHIIGLPHCLEGNCIMSSGKRKDFEKLEFGKKCKILASKLRGKKINEKIIKETLVQDVKDLLSYLDLYPQVFDKSSSYKLLRLGDPSIVEVGKEYSYNKKKCGEIKLRVMLDKELYYCAYDYYFDDSCFLWK